MSDTHLKQARKPGGLPPAEPAHMAALVDYAGGSIVSRALVQNSAGSLTLFAFDTGQALSEHTSPYDAYVQVLDGNAALRIGGQPVAAGAGEIVLMPAGISHALEAKQRFKMLLMMIKA